MRAILAYQSVNPFDGKLLKSFPEFTDRQVEQALAKAQGCFEAWCSIPHSPRDFVPHSSRALDADAERPPRPVAPAA